MNIGGVAVVFNHKNEVLITQRQDLRNWVFPGGGIKKGELIEEAVIREVKEETGIDVKLEKLVTTYIIDHFLRWAIVFVFKAKYKKGKLKRQKGEVLSVKWVAPDQARKLLGKRQLWRLEIALANKKGTPIVVEKKLPIKYWQIPIWWWRRNLGKKLKLVRE